MVLETQFFEAAAVYQREYQAAIDKAFAEGKPLDTLLSQPPTFTQLAEWRGGKGSTGTNLPNEETTAGSRSSPRSAGSLAYDPRSAGSILRLNNAYTRVLHVGPVAPPSNVNAVMSTRWCACPAKQPVYVSPMIKSAGPRSGSPGYLSPRRNVERSPSPATSQSVSRQGSGKFVSAGSRVVVPPLNMEGKKRSGSDVSGASDCMTTARSPRR